MKRLVIAGGGFAGFWAAAAAARLRRDTSSLASLEILLVSREDQLVIRPRLYEPDPASMSVPLIPRLDAIGVEFRQGDVTSIDVADSLLRVADEPIAYGKLVLAAGSQLARPSRLITGSISTLWRAQRSSIGIYMNWRPARTARVDGPSSSPAEVSLESSWRRPFQSDYVHWLEAPRFESSWWSKPIAWGQALGMDRKHPFRTRWSMRRSRCAPARPSPMWIRPA